MTDKDKEFLQTQSTAVIATVDVDGRPSASVIYYTLEDKSLYFITKTSTAKYTNILTNSNVALCIYNEAKRITAELAGQAFEVKDEDDQIKILDKMAIIRRKGEDSWVPPILDIHRGKLVIMRLEISKTKVSDFKHHTKSDD